MSMDRQHFVEVEVGKFNNQTDLVERYFLPALYALVDKANLQDGNKIILSMFLDPRREGNMPLGIKEEVDHEKLRAANIGARLKQEIYWLLNMSETEDKTYPFRALPRGSREWLDLKAERITNFIINRAPHPSPGGVLDRIKDKSTNQGSET